MALAVDLGMPPCVTSHVDQGTNSRPLARAGSPRAVRWVSWIVGFAMLAAVVVVALHISEQRELVHITERAEPWWLALAFVLQAGTYLAQGESWRVVPLAAGVSLPRRVAFKLSLAKLFLDQALPTGGISGTAIVASSLEQRGIERATVMATVVVESASYYAAYVLTLALALIIMIVAGHASALIVATALVFVLFSFALTTTVLVLAGKQTARPMRLARIPVLGTVLSLLASADPALARDRRLIVTSGVWQVVLVLLDVATLWVLIRSLGEVASPTGVFASFMVSTLLRTVSIVPGGLGVFEAASVVTLKGVGVALPVALAATLLFRGLSFWLPMVPGLVFSRRVRKAT